MPETAALDKLTAEQLLHLLRAMLLGYVRAGTPVSWVQSLVVVLARDRLSRSELNEVGYRLAEHMTARAHELTLVPLDLRRRAGSGGPPKFVIERKAVRVGLFDPRISYSYLLKDDDAQKKD